MNTMSFRNLTWQQVTVCVAMLTAVVVAYKLFGELPAGVLLVLSGIVNLLLGRAPTKPDANDGVGPVTLALFVLATGAALQACAAAGDAELDALAAKLARCRAEGRDGGSYDAYERCKTREGIAP